MRLGCTPARAREVARGQRVTRSRDLRRALLRPAAEVAPGGAGSGRDDRERRVAIVEQAQQLPQLRPFTLHDDRAAGEELGGILLA